MIAERLLKIRAVLPANVHLVAVSKFKPVDDLAVAYAAGQRDFGENYVQELVEKQAALPADIRWHFIGHLQRNKVKYIAPFVHLIHSVDSWKLLQEINKQAAAHQRQISCLLQIHIAQEDTKNGLTLQEFEEVLTHPGLRDLAHVKLTGVMGMSTFTQDMDVVRAEFKALKVAFERGKALWSDLTEISMGMSGDWLIAIEEGSTMVRVGSSIFGERNAK